MSDDLTRLACLGYRPFKMRVTDADGARVLLLTRPARFPGGLFWGVPPFGGCWASPQVVQAREGRKAPGRRRRSAARGGRAARADGLRG